MGQEYSYKVVATYNNIGGSIVEGKSSDVKKLTIKKMSSNATNWSHRVVIKQYVKKEPVNKCLPVLFGLGYS